MLSDGTPAPDFALQDQDGRTVTLQDLKGAWTVLWWYPKAFTSG